MSIKCVDTQIMMTRLSDNVRDASAMQKRPEIAQDALAIKERINDAEAQQRVAKTTESEMEDIRTDVDESGGGAYGGKGGRPDEDGQDGQADSDMIVPPGNNLIDIII